MTRDEAVAQIKLQLGFRRNLDDTIVAQLQFAQTVLEQGPTKPWFLLSEDSFIDTTPNEQRIPVPADFLCECDEAVMRYVPTDTEEDEVELTKHDYDELQKAYKDIDPGPPEAYCLLGKYFRIYPTPDDEYRLRQIYYAKALPLTTNIENVWLKENPFVLMGKAGKLIANPVRDKTAFDVFSGWENEGRLLLVSQTEGRDEAGRVRQIGGPT